MNYSTQIKVYAQELGFDIFGITDYIIPKKDKTFLNKWLKQNKNASMKWVNNPKRFDLRAIMPDAKSVITLGINYFHNQELNKNNSGKIARYASGIDYHEIFWSKLKLLSKCIEENILHSRALYYVDTGPILERAFATKASIGFIGKNTCLINERYGSWLLLSEIITNIPLASVKQSRFSKSTYQGCGSCNRCLDACPTGALESPYTLNANKCISYLTIENKGNIPIEFRKAINNRLFGCDICQEVCPWNLSRQQHAQLKELNDKPIAGDFQLLKKILKIKNDSEFKSQFPGSPMLRTKRNGIVRNACVVAGNIGDKTLIPYLDNLLNDNEMIREHATWAINEINHRSS